VTRSVVQKLPQGRGEKDKQKPEAKSNTSKGKNQTQRRNMRRLKVHRGKKRTLWHKRVNAAHMYGDNLIAVANLGKGQKKAANRPRNCNFEKKKRGHCEQRPDQTSKRRKTEKGDRKVTHGEKRSAQRKSPTESPSNWPQEIVGGLCVKSGS